MQQRATRLLCRTCAALCLLLGLAIGAAGQDQESPAPPVVPLDQLLKLPSSAPVEASIERRGGDTKAEWQARFRAAHKDVSEADSALQEVRDKLEEAAGDESAWTMSAPGLGGAQDPTNAPLDYRLSQDMKRKREESARAHQALRDLEVEANLAGVPDGWRTDEPEKR